MSVWCFLVAALPIAASEFGLIPVHESQRRMLPAVASFFCFLGFAYVFSLRHGLARTMFGARLPSTRPESADTRPSAAPINQVLACLILASLGGAATYLSAFEGGRALATFPELPRSYANVALLAFSYVAMFLLAEAAFAIMAVREYLQDLLGLSDAEVITGVSRGAEQTMAGSSTRSASLVISYTVVPPGASSEDQLSQFDSELDVPAHGGAPGPELVQNDDEMQFRTEAGSRSAENSVTGHMARGVPAERR